MSGQLQERRAGDRELQILGGATEKLRAPNAVRTNGTVSRLVLEDRRQRVGSVKAKEAVSNVKY